MVRKSYRRLRCPVELDARLRAVREELGVSAVDQVWVFPPLPYQDPSAEFLLLSCFDGAPGRRRVFVARLLIEPLGDEGGDEVRWVQRLEPRGAAPRDVIPRVAERLVHRVGDSAPPIVGEIGGTPERWEDFLARVGNGGAPADGNGHARVDTGGGLG